MLNTSSSFVPLIYSLAPRLPLAREGKMTRIALIEEGGEKKKEGGERRRSRAHAVTRIPAAPLSQEWLHYTVVGVINVDEVPVHGRVHTGMSGVRAAAYLCQTHARTHACDSKVAWYNKGEGGLFLWEIQQRDTVISKRAVLQTGCNYHRSPWFTQS